MTETNGEFQSDKDSLSDPAQHHFLQVISRNQSLQVFVENLNSKNPLSVPEFSLDQKDITRKKRREFELPAFACSIILVYELRKIHSGVKMRNEEGRGACRLLM